MEFEDQEEHEEGEGMGIAGASYDSTRVKMTTSEVVTAATAGNTTALATPAAKARYRECLKNHAVGIGGHAVDGCGEFIAAGAEGTLDALKCAACNCHRNFHRKELNNNNNNSPQQQPQSHVVTGEQQQQLFFHHHHQVPQFAPYYRTPAGYLHVGGPVRPLALPSTSGGGQSRELDQEDGSNRSGGGGGGGGGGSSSRKRFRTKFSQEQKERMLGLAERLGWRIQKHDEAVVQHFCNETGVKRHVLKVWMHNNKHTLGKKP